MPAFFGRVLAEHVRRTPAYQAWIREADWIIPVPAAPGRTAERGVDIVGQTGEHLSSRLGIPAREDFLQRGDASERARSTKKAALAEQYLFRRPKAGEIRGRTVTLPDDVMNRGHTAGACASRLRKSGCARVVLLVLARAESSLQSDRHARDDPD